MNDFRKIPSIDSILQDPECQNCLIDFGHNLTVAAAREVLAEIRSSKTDPSIERKIIIHRIIQLLHLWTTPSLKPVINATGVILHTNLGRSPLNHEALSNLVEVSSSYSTLEFDLEKGTRGSRHTHLAGILQQLTGAEDALVVNNNAAAVLLVLSALGSRKPALISRTQLVEIGGGFRIPDVMKQSGVKLIEVGTTNRVHLADYEEQLQAGVKLVVRAHSSNFKIIGFHNEPGFSDLVQLAHKYDAVVIDDLGSGALFDTAAFGLTHEPMVQESVAAGADIVCFSGDKLLGGPQAGIIVGRKTMIDKIKKHPLARAVRADKLAISTLFSTLTSYLRGTALQDIPIWALISRSEEAIKEEAVSWQRELGFGKVIASESTVGGGSLPGDTLPTWVLAIRPRSASKVMQQLRSAHPPIIARIELDNLVLDPRTVLKGQSFDIISILRYMNTEGYFEE